MKRINVGFLFLHPLSESLGSVVRVLGIARNLVKIDNRIRCFIFSPFEKSLKIQRDVYVVNIPFFSSGDLLGKRIYKTMRVGYYSRIAGGAQLKGIFNSNFITRSIAKGFVKKTMKRGIKIDVLVIVQDFAIISGLLIARILNLPTILDLHNLSLEEMVASGTVSKNTPLYRHMEKKFSMLLRLIDHIVVVSNFMREYLNERFGIPNAKITLVPPSGEVRINKLPPRPRPYRLVYAGMVSYREHVDLFVKSLKFVQKEITDYTGYITRKGDMLSEIYRLIRMEKVNAKFFWFERIEDLNRFLKCCHVGALPSSGDVARRLGPPVKLFTYASFGLPVVANYVGGWSDIIKKREIGILTKDDPQDFAEGIVQLLSDKELYFSMARNALDLIKSEYNWFVSAKKFYDVIQNFIS